MCAFKQPPTVFRRAAEAEAGLVSYLRLASLLCLEMPSRSLDAVRTVISGLPDVDPALVASGRYFVADLDGELIGGAGWSVLPLGYRGDRLLGEDGLPTQLRLGGDAVLIRGFFLDPDGGRRGAAASLLAHVEADVLRAGYRVADTIGPATSQVYYRGLGFKAVRKLQLRLDRDHRLPMLQMRKCLSSRLALAA